jgi:hypothetical protein
MLKFDFASVPKTPKEFTRKDIVGVEEKIVKVYNSITDEQLWRANVSPLCGFCDFADVCKDCPEKYRPKNENKEGFGETGW